MYQVLRLCASVGMLHYPAKNYVTKQKSVNKIRVNISAVALR